jgi:alkylation response protein AidB-like acyl-CoA dehydrogenase
VTPVDSLRAELRAFLAVHGRPRTDDDERISIFSDLTLQTDIDAARKWQAALDDAGLGAVTWPVEHGGRGGGLVEALVVAEEMARYDTPGGILQIGIGMVGPTLIAHGTPEQQARYLPPMRRGEEIWCQLWSEPGAGSDLAALSTRADADGDDLVLNGQKVWTSGAQYSELGLGLFRSDRDAAKHRGISCVIVPMSLPGITVRPLRQMTGDAHFNEVFFDDVRVPAANVVGALHDGWTVARTTMMYERSGVGSLGAAPGAFRALARLARTTSDPIVRQALARAYTLGWLFDVIAARVRDAIGRGGMPGPESSVLKLLIADLGSARAELALALQGAAGMLAGDDAPEGGRWQQAFLGAPGVHIGGGTDEVQRNAIGEHVLGLPREPKPQPPN